MGYNATVTGRVGQSAELKESSTGTKYAKFSIALDNYNSKTKQKGVVWIEVTIFGKTAEIKTPYLVAGTPVTVAGELSLYVANNERDGGSKTIVQLSGESVALFPVAAKTAVAGSDDSDIPF
jgi:single-stranded DNA-binding protein